MNVDVEVKINKFKNKNYQFFDRNKRLCICDTLK